MREIIGHHSRRLLWSRLTFSPTRFASDPAIIRQRVRAPLGRVEAFALFFSLGFVGINLWLHAKGVLWPNDFSDYMSATRGDYSGYYYAYWFLPVLKALALLPREGEYVVWASANILGVFLAARVWGGSVTLALISYQLLYVVVYGAITGVILGALAVFWWAMAARRWEVAGAALVIACTKYALGLPLGLALWLLADLTWRERVRLLVLPVCVALLSLVVYPLWPERVITTISDYPPADWGSISLWQWIGPLALLLWVPVIILPLSRGRRMIGVTAAAALALPYFQQTDLLCLFALPVGWLGLLGNFGYLYIWYEWTALKLLAVIPLIAYVVALAPGVRQGRRKPVTED